MNKKDIKIGKTYKIVGNNSGCNGNKCNSCKYYPDHLIVATGFDRFENKERNISGKRLTGSIHCTFNPADLKPLEPSSLKELLE